ncbi:class I SAM-dependent methyltransferase [Lysinibacillus fusiformis]|uniref:class I SAM-dependent methyltransferase n=1 Tax=Lysinibacillus fusiformis TaxID=28031 RepID=UPI00046A0507|nr:class I SAM-dependent methyltransferase [Lysinibacillus fusiformis]
MDYKVLVKKIKTKKVICFGASDAARKLFELMPLLKVELFVDNDINKQGHLFLDKPVCNPTILKSIPRDDYFIVITSSYKNEITMQLKEHGYNGEQDFCDFLDVKNSLNLNLKFENGHYYSPIPNLHEIKANEQNLFSKKKKIPGVKINEEDQLSLFTDFLESIKLFHQMIHEKNGLRYYIKNGFFEFFDAATLYSILKSFKPKRIIEVGSGFSSSVMLDTRDKLNLNMELTFIEPFPDRLNYLLTEEDKENSKIIVSKVQDVHLDIFKNLDAGDILFIDSSHVSKIGSDVNYLIFEVLPELKEGVIIHFHDIFFPFEYPQEWLYKGYYWNEAYILRSFLQYNKSFSIIYWNDFIYQKEQDKLKDEYLSIDKTFGGSIWIKKN